MFAINRLSQRPLTWWYERQGDIDFTPTYQRHSRLWSPKEKAYLIDSILNGYDIPKIYVADFASADSSLNEKKKLYAIIDGKRRFEVVFEFFQNKLRLNKDFKYERDTSLQLGGLCYSDLWSRYPSVCNQFNNYEFDVIGVVTDRKDTITDLFIRLDKTSKSLSGLKQDI